MGEKHGHYIPLSQRILAGQLMRERNESGKTINQISEQIGISHSHLCLLERKSYGSRGERSTKIWVSSKIYWTFWRVPLKFCKEKSFSNLYRNNMDLNEGMDEEEKVSVRTGRHHANLKGLTVHMSWFKPGLIPLQVQTRLNFAEKYESKDMQLWRFLLFCDESRIKLYSRDCRKRVLEAVMLNLIGVIGIQPIVTPEIQ